MTHFPGFNPAYFATGTAPAFPNPHPSPFLWLSFIFSLTLLTPITGTPATPEGTVSASVQFRDVGVIMQTDAYVLVTIHHNFDAIHELCEEKDTLVPKLEDTHAHYYHSGLENKVANHVLILTIDEVQTHLSDICFNFNTLFYYSPLDKNATRTRHTRGLGTAISVASAFTSGISALSSLIGWIHQVYQAHLVDKRFTVQETASQHMAHQVKQTIGSIKDLAQLFRNTANMQKLEVSFIHIRTNLLELRSYLDRLTSGVALLQQEKLSPEILPIGSLQRILSETERIANVNNLHTAAKSPMELLHLPATYSAQPFHLEIVFAIPLTSKVLPLQQFLQAPIVTPNGDNSYSLMEIVPDKDFIAQDRKSATCAALDLADLQSCLKIGSTYMCAGMAMYSEAEESCIGALHEQDASAVTRMCTFRESLKQLFLTPRKAGLYALATATQQSVSIFCLNGDNAIHSFAPGQHIITLEQGCTVKTDTIIVHRPRDNLATITVQGELALKVQSVRSSALTPAGIIRDIEQAATPQSFGTNISSVTSAVNKITHRVEQTVEATVEKSVFTSILAYCQSALIALVVCLALVGLLAILGLALYCKLRRDHARQFQYARHEMREDLERMHVVLNRRFSPEKIRATETVISWNVYPHKSSLITL